MTLTNTDQVMLSSAESQTEIIDAFRERSWIQLNVTITQKANMLGASISARPHAYGKCGQEYQQYNVCPVGDPTM